MIKATKIFAKSILYGLVGIFLLFFLLVLLLRVPANQTLLAQYFAPKIEKAIGYPLTVRAIQLKFFDEISFWGLRVKDPWGKEMIHIERLDINFNLSDILFQGSNPHLDYARLYQPKVHLIFEKKSGKMNLDEFIVRIDHWLNPGPSVAGPSSKFEILDAEVVDGSFMLDDQQIKSEATSRHFDLNHLIFTHINAKVKDFFVQGDTLGLQTIGLKALDPISGLNIKSLDTKFMYADKQMRFDQLNLFFNDSQIKNQIVFDYSSTQDFKSWNKKVRMKAYFDNSQIRGEDLGRFVSDMYQYKGMYKLKGNLDGPVARLNLKNFEMAFGSKSVLRGDFSFQGLPEIDKTVMNFDMVNSLFHPQDLQVFLSKSAVEKMNILGPVSFGGKFSGTNKDFSTSGKLNTGLGYMEGDVMMNLSDSMAFSKYQGKLKLKKFKLGKLFSLEEYLGTIDLEAQVKGSGFSSNSAKVDFDGQVSEINIKRYAYRRVSLKGNLQRQLFKGLVSVKDSNLLAQMTGEINLRQEKPVYNLEGRIDHVDLGRLRITDTPMQLVSDFQVNIAMNDLDDLEGRATFSEAILGTPKKLDLPIHLLTFSSDLKGPKRHYRLNSDLISVEAEGDFVPSQLQKDLSQLWEEYTLYFTKNEAERAAYYAAKSHETNRKYVSDFTVICHDAKPILTRWFPTIDLAKNTVFSGSVNKGRSVSLSLESYPDTLVLGGYKFYQSIFSFQSSKFLGGPEVSSSLVFQSRRQHLNFLTPTENLKLDGLWDQDRINFELDFKQQGDENLAHLGGVWRFEKDGLSLRFKDTYLRILGQDWAVDPENKISIQGKELHAEHFLISNQKQSIALQGSLSMDSTETLRLRANKFQLGTLAPLFSLKVQGELNAEINIQDWYQHTRLDTWLLVDSLHLNKFYIGNLQGVGSYNADLKTMDLNYHLNRLGESVVEVNGTYKPFETRNKLDISAELNKTNLSILEPFTQGVFSGLAGDASGKLKVRGTIEDPDIQGKIVLQKAKLFFDYLKTSMAFSDTVEFKTRQIIGRNWKISDPEGNTAKLNANFVFPVGSPFEMNIEANLNRFKLLNTQRDPTSFYYGTGYTSGPISIRGALHDLLITADLKSERGTRLYIPLDRESSTENDEDYEFFSKSLQVDLNANTQQITSKLKEGGISLDLDLAFTPEAYGEVQIDKKKGDLMRIYGTGNINMTLDKKGQFRMVGDYAIDQGDYTFTLQNLINKRFAIQRGSKISWTGDPLEANVNIKAIYTQYASLFPILLDTTNKSNLPEFKRRYPVDVTINLQNRLLSPNISFDIGIRDYPKDVHLNGAVTAFTNRIKTDEQELTRQVSNVLLFGQLVSPFGGSGIALGNLVGNFTEMLSNQLSNLASQINKDLNIDVYLGGGNLNQDILSNLQLRASYNVNDRLRITRSGGFTDARNQTSPLILLGDWALEYFVKRDGSLRLKTYNRNVQTTLLGSLNSYQINQTLGASLLYNRSFNKLFGK
ncbi:translocation/assembly module TamB domain-containing protein [Aquirufa sp. Wall-65K1]